MIAGRGEGMAKTPQWFDSAPLPKKTGSKKLKKALGIHGLKPWPYLQNYPSVYHVEVSNGGEYEKVNASFLLKSGETVMMEVTENAEGQQAIIALLEILVRAEKLFEGAERCR